MTEPAANFHKLDARLRLRGRLETVTGLHVGGTDAGRLEGTDRTVLRDADGFPFIGGSSLKGVLRSTLESLVRAAGRRDRGIWSCDPLDERPASAGGSCGSVAKESDEANASEPEPCCICRLFGSRSLASHVRISDALLPESARRGFAPIELRDGVAIDRDLGTVRDNLKYDYEVVRPGTSFALEVFVENPEEWLLGLLAVGFEQLHEGFSALGGFTSRGLGRVTIAWESLERIEAKGLLSNEEPKVLEGSAVTDAFASWRGALAEHVHQENG